MGLKSGSRDSGLNDSADEQDEDGDTDRQTERQSRGEQHPKPDDSRKTAAEEDSEDGTERPNKSESSTPPEQVAVDSIPYKLRRSNVNEGREQVPYFLRPEVTASEDQLKQTLEDELGETVYKSDYREAAMVVAQRNPDLIAAVLREWGYDFGTE